MCFQSACLLGGSAWAWRLKSRVDEDEASEGSSSILHYTSAARRGAEEEGAAEQESFRCKAAVRAAASAFRGRADPRARYPLLSSTSSPSARVRVVRGRVWVALSSRAPHHQSTTTTTARAGEPCRLC